ncbi:hypothetical protein [Marinactinospora rubrisoli]|uniref:Serine/threonine protein kinase n=1 Tax=Marinactinospora rubrisoli TaxID=2715399 RepID=A0ABW2KQB3_9ACTN
MAAEDDLPVVPGYRVTERLPAGVGADRYRARGERGGERVLVRVLRPADGGPRPADDRPRPYAVVAEEPPDSYAALLGRHGPLPVEQVIEVGLAIAAELESLHEGGLVHNDVRPETLLIRGASAELAPGRDVGSRAGETFPPMTVDWRGYAHVPPEAFRGGLVSPRSDVYRLASTLWTLLAGHAPFVDGPDEEPEPEVYRERVAAGTLPRTPREDVPAGLATVLRTAMAGEPHDRHRDAADFSRALTVARSGGGAAADRPVEARPQGTEPPAATGPSVESGRRADPAGEPETAPVAEPSAHVAESPWAAPVSGEQASAAGQDGSPDGTEHPGVQPTTFPEYRFEDAQVSPGAEGPAAASGADESAASGTATTEADSAAAADAIAAWAPPVGPGDDDVQARRTGSGPGAGADAEPETPASTDAATTSFPDGAAAEYQPFAEERDPATTSGAETSRTSASEPSAEGAPVEPVREERFDPAGTGSAMTLERSVPAGADTQPPDSAVAPEPEVADDTSATTPVEAAPEAGPAVSWAAEPAATWPSPLPQERSEADAAPIQPDTDQADRPWSEEETETGAETAPEPSAQPGRTVRPVTPATVGDAGTSRTPEDTAATTRPPDHQVAESELRRGLDPAPEPAPEGAADAAAASDGAPDRQPAEPSFSSLPGARPGQAGEGAPKPGRVGHTSGASADTESETDTAAAPRAGAGGPAAPPESAAATTRLPDHRPAVHSAPQSAPETVTSEAAAASGTGAWPTGPVHPRYSGAQPGVAAPGDPAVRQAARPEPAVATPPPSVAAAASAGTEPSAIPSTAPPRRTSSMSDETRARLSGIGRLVLGSVLTASLVIAVLGGVALYVASRQADDPAPSPNASMPATAPDVTEIPPEAGVNPELAPTGAEISLDAGSTVRITWQDNTQGRAEYYVVGGPLGTTPRTLAGAEQYSSQVEITGLNPSVDYCFTVMAIVGVDEVAPSQEVCTSRSQGA